MRFYQQIRGISQRSIDKLRPIPKDQLVWKTDESDPRKHTQEHEGLFYLLPNDEKQTLAIYGNTVPLRSVQSFQDSIGIRPVMIRRPALTGMDYLRKFQPDKPKLKVVFYGDPGHGKSHTLVHLLHYLHMMDQYIVFNIRSVRQICRCPWNLSESTSRPGRIDNSLDAAVALQQFKLQNAPLLEKYKDTLTCSKEYTWSLRETTKAGDPVVNIADHGINRVNHASDCLAALCNELMLACDAGKIKLVSVLDDVGWLFPRVASNLKHTDNRRILVDEITIARALKKLIKNDYKNGIVLATCDNCLSTKQNQSPQDALGAAGWESFDPFLPVNVPKFSRKEFESFMNLYQDIGWFSRPETCTREARDELRFISGMNPKQLFELSKSL